MQIGGGTNEGLKKIDHHKKLAETSGREDGGGGHDWIGKKKGL